MSRPAARRCCAPTTAASCEGQPAQKITQPLTSLGDARSPHPSLGSSHPAAPAAETLSTREPDMTITTTTLTKAAGLAAVAGGLLFCAVQINHPVLNAPFTTTTEYAVRETAKIFMAVFSLVGITGIYLRQVRQTGLLGLLGYVALTVGYLTKIGRASCRERV